MNGCSVWGVLSACSIWFLSACAAPTPENPSPESLRSVLPSEDWILLVRPSSGWESGAIVDVQDPDTRRGDPEFGASFPQLCGIPPDVWHPRDSSGGGLELTGEYLYNIDISGTLKFAAIDAAQAGLDVNNSASRVINIVESHEDPVAYLYLTNWLTNAGNGGVTNFEKLSDGCQQYLLGRQYRIIGNTFALVKGTISSERKVGKPDAPLFKFSSPKLLKRVADLNAEFDAQYLEKGVLRVDETKPPLVLALRELDVSKELLRDPRIAEVVQARGLFGVADGLGRPPLRDILAEEGIAFR